ncbi:MAG: T9SS type A sorting domain-containing protein [Candidatus Latescibacterota bacterium]
MNFKRPWVLGVFFIFFLLFTLMSAMGVPATRDALTLDPPQNLSVRSEMDRISSTFRVYLTFDGIPNTDSTGTFINPPNMDAWSITTPLQDLAAPTVGGIYTGMIDRTIVVEALHAGRVGINDTLDIRYEIQRETHYSRIVSVGSKYTIGTPIDMFFVNANNVTDTLDLGLQISFSGGRIDKKGRFYFGCEDFEGYHLWRGIEADGSDLVAIAELSKEEAMRGGQTGGSVVDSVYYFVLIPALRTSGVFFFPFAVECLGNRIALDLEDNEFFWYDCNAYNGFTYYYLVTTFDRDYNIASSTQGLQKLENCLPILGKPYPCPENFVAMTINVDTLNTLPKIYAVPNPYRTGGSVFTTTNYHNFPDNKIRFVNVPAQCTIRIYTVSGDLIWEKNYDNETGGNIEWDVRNLSSEDVHSGIYVYKVEDTKGDYMYGRLVIIR